MIHIGTYTFDSILALAPMAGVSDRPMRALCRQFGANYTPTEMVSSQPQLRTSKKSQQRLSFHGEAGPIIVQIAGTEPEQLAESARYHIENGADMIDINMGCPAKKVCNVAAGSALLSNEQKVVDILHTVVNATSAPVTLKIRTGSHRENKNALNIARIAEDAGVSLLTIHGRTRADKFLGEAEYDTIAAVKQAINIPVIANGDISSPKKAAKVLAHTQADGLMIGRAAQGNPWIFNQVAHYLQTNTLLEDPQPSEIRTVFLAHIASIHAFYGDYLGVRIARKHIGWWFLAHAALTPGFKTAKHTLFKAESNDEQYRLLTKYLNDLLEHPQTNPSVQDVA